MKPLKINDLNKDARKTMSTRITTAIILALIALPCLFAGGWYFLTISLVALVIAIHEFTNAPMHDHYNPLVHLFIFGMTIAIVYWIFVKSNVSVSQWHMNEWSFENGLSAIEVSSIGVAITVSGVFLFSILNKNFTINDATYLFTMIIYVGLSFQAVLFLRYFPKFAFANDIAHPIMDLSWWQSSFLLVYVLIGTMFSDMGAYFVGVLFGHNKMNPRISPKKTWEGFIGGGLISFAVSFLFAFVVDRLGYPILPFLNWSHWYWVFIISLIMPLFANLGDFLFSAIKRNFNLKDYGTLLRGMGGVLDRLDSVLMTSLVVAIIITYIYHGWSLFA